MNFQNFINESKTETIEEFFAVTDDGKKFYNVNGHQYTISLFKDDSILHESKKDAQLVLDALTPEDGYEGLKIVKVKIQATIEEV